MTIRFDDSGFSAALGRLTEAAEDLVNDGAAVCQETAQRLADVDTGQMRNQVTLVPARGGGDAAVEARAPHSFFREFGTGIFHEGGGGSREPWVYYSDEYGFVTTTGAPASPFMRPAYAAGKAFIVAEGRRRFGG